MLATCPGFLILYINLYYWSYLCPFKLFEVIQKIGRVVSLSPLTPPLTPPSPRRTKHGEERLNVLFVLFFLLSLHVCLSITLVFGYDFWTVANKLWRIGYKTNVHAQLLNVLKIKVHVIRSNPVFVWLSVGNP